MDKIFEHVKQNFQGSEDGITNILEDIKASQSGDRHLTGSVDSAKDSQNLVEKKCLPTLQLIEPEGVNPAEQPKLPVNNVDRNASPARMYSDRREESLTNNPMSPEERKRLDEIVSEAMKRLYREQVREN